MRKAKEEIYGHSWRGHGGSWSDKGQDAEDSEMGEEDDLLWQPNPEERTAERSTT